MPKQLKDVSDASNAPAKIWVQHPDGSREELPDDQATPYDWVSGDTFEAKTGVKFKVAFVKTTLRKKKGEDKPRKLSEDQEISVTGYPATIDIPDPCQNSLEMSPS